MAAGAATARGGSEHLYFRFDAWRCAQNIAMDYAWLGGAASAAAGVGQDWPSQYANRLHSFFVSKGLAGYGNQYTLDGNTTLSSTHSGGLVAMNAVAALAATDATAWSFVEALWEEKIPTGQFRYYDGMLYMLGLMHVSGNFRIWTNTSRAIPLPGPGPGPGGVGAGGGPTAQCAAALTALCHGARQSSAGNCFICCGQHQRQLMVARCSQPDFDSFCHQRVVT